MNLLPLDLPVSINELALLPLIPRLLLRVAFVFLISLFRRIIGVSANGKAIFVASNVTSIGCVWSCCGSFLARSLSMCDLSPPWSGFSSLEARSFLLFLTGKAGGSAFSCSPLCLVLLLLAVSPPFSTGPALGEPVAFFFGFLVGAGSACSSCLGSSAVLASTAFAFAFFARVRVNANPSASSSQAINSVSHTSLMHHLIQSLPNEAPRKILFLHHGVQGCSPSCLFAADFTPAPLTLAFPCFTVVL